MLRGCKAQYAQNEEYLNICIKYRLVSLLLSTLAHIFGIVYYKEFSITSVVIICGMLISCIVGNYLYISFRNSKSATLLIISIELFAYGIFIFLSGGFISPYMTYYLSCILISIDQGYSYMMCIVAAVWCFVCALLSRFINHAMQIKINIMVGVIVVILAFCVLHYYMRILGDKKGELERLNEQLKKENERTEEALLQMSDMYEGFGLIAMTDRDKIISQLAALITNNIAPNGCMFIEKDLKGSAAKILSLGISRETGEHLLSEAALIKPYIEEIDSNLLKTTVVNGRKYEFIYLDGAGGDIIFLVVGTEETDEDNTMKKNFYIRLSEIIFRALDTQSRIENYITADEKNRISDEIHDTVIQKLFGLSCSLGELRSNVAKLTEEEVNTKLEDLQQSARITMRELRETIYGRSFEISGEKSFVNQLKTYMEEMQKFHNIKIEQNIHIGRDSLSAAQKIVMYRIACEAVNNSIRHGESKNISINIEEKEGKIYLLVEDDGKGVEEGEFITPKGHGIYNMYHMAALLKGKLSVKKKEEGGIRVDLVLLV